MIDIDVREKGYFLNGDPSAVITNYLRAVEDEVAQVGVNDVRIELGAVLRHRTGYYESRVQTERRYNEAVVNDGNVVYGPWLEGVGSRNKSTRFKGYFTFRRVAQALNGKADNIARGMLANYIKRMD